MIIDETRSKGEEEECGGPRTIQPNHVYLGKSYWPELHMFVVPYLELEGRTLFTRPYARGEMSEYVSKLSDKFKMVYVADLDGLNKNKPQLDVVREISEEMPTMYEGGVRKANNVIDMLITGAEKAVVGTATLLHFEDLRLAFKLSENITFKADFRDGIVSFDPHIAGRAFRDLTGEVVDIGIKDIAVPRQLASEAAAAKAELGFSLGVFSSVDERDAMERLGADYVIARDYGSLMGNE